MKVSRWLFVFWLGCGLTVLHAEDTPWAQLSEAMAERLGVMEAVARFKAQQSLPIEDLARERVVLARAAEAASVKGLDPAAVEAFVQAQMNVAKVIQYRWRAEWLIEPPAEAAVELAPLRETLLQTDQKILQTIRDLVDRRETISAGHYDRFAATLELRFLEAREKRLLFDRLQAVIEATLPD